jgi:hypothetical protein
MYFGKLLETVWRNAGKHVRDYTAPYPEDNNVHSHRRDSLKFHEDGNIC